MWKRSKAKDRRIEPIGSVTAVGQRAGDTSSRLPQVVRDRIEPGFPTIDGPHYLDVLKTLHEILVPEWYLEIGTFRGRSLSLCPGRFVAIDPEFLLTHFKWAGAPRGHFFQQTSDDFFAGDFLDRNGIRPELAFLDGMHLFEYLLRDFVNYERVAKPGSMVVLHDCVPGNSRMEARDRAVAGQGMPWTGDVWKVLLAILDHRPDLRVDVLDAYPTGLVVVRGLDPSNTSLADAVDEICASMATVTLKDLGPDTYFDRFEIRSAHAFIEALRSETSQPGS